MAAADPIANLLDADGRPRWELLQREPICSRCGYNLTLLERPRCPECGFEFAWRDIAEAASRNRNEDWLFEYAWRKRPVRSLIVTGWRALWPWSFWRRLSIHDPIGPGALAVLFAIVALGSTVAAFLGVILHILSVWYGPPWGWSSNKWLGISPPGIGWMAGAAVAAVFLMTGQFLAVLTGWLILTASLRQTLTRCRVRVLQLLRVAVYSAIPFQVLVFAGHTLVWIATNGHATGPSVIAHFVASDLVLWLLLAGIAAVPLGPAYLNLKHPVSVTFLSSFVAILAHRVGWFLHYIGY